MKRISVILTATLVAFLMGGSWAWATPPGDDGEHKVSICHRTASDTNPYVFIEVDEASLSPGHLDNDDPGHKPTFWKSDGIFRGVEHQAGDPKDDYLAQSPEDCEDNTVVEPEPFVPLAHITTECGRARVELAYKFGDDTDPPAMSEEFVVLIDSKVQTKINLKQNEDIWFPYEFGEDTGDHTITVAYGKNADEFLASATVRSNCEKPEPTPTPTPTVTPTPPTPDNPDKPEPNKPQNPQEELPHTGGSLVAAGIAAALLAAGSGMVWFSRRRLTGNL